MKEEIEKLLPLIKSGQLPKPDVEELANRIRQVIKEEPSKGRELGPLFNLVNQALKQKAKMADIHWVEVGNGALAIGHKPGGKLSFEGMKNAGVSVVLTLLHDNEAALAVGNHLEKTGIGWVWFPFSASRPHAGNDIVAVYSLYRKLEDLLNSGHRIYVHCSAGIHRTGMITYGLLRYLGKEKAEALHTLRLLREVTADGVGEERLAWGDQFNRK